MSKMFSTGSTRPFWAFAELHPLGTWGILKTNYTVIREIRCLQWEHSSGIMNVETYAPTFHRAADASAPSLSTAVAAGCLVSAGGLRSLGLNGTRPNCTQSVPPWCHAVIFTPRKQMLWESSVIILFLKTGKPQQTSFLPLTGKRKYNIQNKHTVQKLTFPNHWRASNARYRLVTEGSV